MSTYLVKLMFNINIDNDSNNSQFDEQTRVVEALSEEEAFQKARAIGRKEEETFLNSENKLVLWKFIDVMELYSISAAKDGEQIYSSTHKKTDTNSFINYIRQKAMVIQAKNLTFA